MRVSPLGGCFVQCRNSLQKRVFRGVGDIIAISDGLEHREVSSEWDEEGMGDAVRASVALLSR